MTFGQDEPQRTGTEHAEAQRAGSGQAGPAAAAPAQNGETAEGKTLLVAELWYQGDPGLSSGPLREQLAVRFPGAAFSEGVILLPHREHSFELSGKTVSLSTGVAAPSEPLLAAAALEATPTDQSWTWPDAEKVVSSCTHRILVTEVLSSTFEPKPRVESFRSVLQFLVAETGPAAIRWLHNSHWREPGELEAAHPLAGPVNMRFFLVASDEGAMVVDSLGMYQLGLPDVQIHFRDKDPNMLVELAFNVAAYLYENGPVIAGGATLNGPDGLVLTCSWEDSLIGPLRTVIDLDPGEPYSAGRRG